MSKQACGLCGNDDVRYCHGDFDADPTCYMRAQWKGVGDLVTDSPFTVTAVDAGEPLSWTMRPKEDTP